MSRISDLLAEHERLRTERTIYESIWDQIAARILPTQQLTQTPVSQTDPSLFDATGSQALGRFAAALNGFLTPPNQKWHHLKAPAGISGPFVARFCERARDVLFELRYARGGGFQPSIVSTWLSTGAFGNGVMFEEDDLGRAIRYACVPIKEVYFATDAFGRVDLFHRAYTLKARQLPGYFDALPPELVELAEKKPFEDVELLHIVRPRKDRDPSRRDRFGMRFESWHVARRQQRILREGGYRTMPYQAARYTVVPGETYGRGPAHTVLPDIKLVNRMKRSVIAQGNRAAEPPLGSADEDIKFDFTPNAINPGAVSADGRPLVLPLAQGSQWQLPMNVLESTQDNIREAFLDHLWQLLVEKKGDITATEIMARSAEKGVLLGPVLAMLQEPFLGGTIERELDIASAAGLLPEMPEELRQAGGLVTVDYDSPLNRAQRAPEAMAIMDAVQATAVLAQVDPSVWDDWDVKEANRLMLRYRGVPELCIATPDQREQNRALREQQQQQAMALAAAGPLAKAAKDAAAVQSAAAA